MTELEGERSKLFKTSKIIKIGLEYKELEQNEDCSVLGSFGNTECWKQEKKYTWNILKSIKNHWFSSSKCQNFKKIYLLDGLTFFDEILCKK